MQRGILVLGKEELQKVKDLISQSTCSNSLLCGKIQDAYEHIQEENRIFVSEEELEDMLDSIGIEENDMITKNTVEKINNQLRNLRGI